MDIMNFLIGSTCNIFSTDSANEAFVNVIAAARLVVRVLQILVPVALIVWGTLDLGKSVIAGDEKKIKENQGRFVKRVVAAVIVFLIPWIVGLIMGTVGGDEWKQCWNAGKTFNVNKIKSNGSLEYK